MTTIDEGRPATPWLFWLIAVAFLAWNCIGGFDYTMSHVQGEAYMRQGGMTEGQIAFMRAYPVWMHAVWAIGVWGSVAGSLLLLARMRWATHAFVLSTLGAAGSLLYSAVTAGGGAPGSLLFPAIIVAICLVEVWYCMAMTKRGVLR